MNRLVSSFLLAAVAVAQSPEPESVRRPFTRVIERPDGGQLDVLVATYTKGEATVVLHGALHVADPEHYAELQRRFATCDALLYELIADEDLRPHPGMELEESDWFSQLQTGFGRGLGLADQVANIDYRPAHFVHADLTTEEWEAALDRAGSSLLGEVFQMGTPPDPDREAEGRLRKPDFVAAMRRGTGKHELRIAFARLLAEPDGTRREPTVIIEARNERCLEVLQQQLAAGRKKLGVYYGAGHMEHLERRLVRDLGWTRTGEEWLMAWDNRAGRFPPEEKGLQQKRYRARQDLDTLGEALRSWVAAHPKETPTWETLRAANGGKLPGRADGVDPWGRAYVLRANEGTFEVRCVGSDGVAGTADDLPSDGSAPVVRDLMRRAAEDYGRAKRARVESLDAERQAREALDRAAAADEAAAFAAAANAFRDEHGTVPKLEDLGAGLVTIDPWCTRYRIDVAGSALRVRSAGPDRRMDTEDDLVSGK